MSNMKRKWEWSFSRYKIGKRFEIQMGVYPPDEDDYYPGSWSFHLNILGFVFGGWTYLDDDQNL